MICLPNELVLIIFRYCDVRSILNFCRVYREYKSIGKVIIIEKYNLDNLTKIQEKYKKCRLWVEYCGRMFYTKSKEPLDNALKLEVSYFRRDYREKNAYVCFSLLKDFRDKCGLKYYRNVSDFARLICVSVSKNNKLMYVLSVSRSSDNIQLEIVNQRMETIKRYIYKNNQTNICGYHLSRSGILYHHSGNTITIYKKTNIKTIKFPEEFKIVTDIQQHKNKLYIACKDLEKMVIYDMERGTTKTITHIPHMRISDNRTIVTMSSDPCNKKACIVSIYDLYDVELIYQVKLKRCIIDSDNVNSYITVFCYSKL